MMEFGVIFKKIRGRTRNIPPGWFLYGLHTLRAGDAAGIPKAIAANAPNV